MIVVFLKSQVCLFNKNSTAVVEQSGFFGGGLAPFIVLFIFSKNLHFLKFLLSISNSISNKDNNLDNSITRV